MIIKNSTIIQTKQYLLKNQGKNNFPLIVNNLLLQLLTLTYLTTTILWQ